MPQETITMSRKEIDRLGVIQQVAGMWLSQKSMGHFSFVEKRTFLNCIDRKPKCSASNLLFHGCCRGLMTLSFFFI